MSERTVQSPGAAPAPAIPEALKGVRRTAVIAVIVSLSIAALLGIIALFGGPWGDLQFRVMLTTLAVAAFSILALLNITLIQLRSQLLVWLTLAAATVGFVISILLIWWLQELDWNRYGELIDALAKACWTGWVLAVAGSHANLMRFVGRGGSGRIKLLVALTIACSAIIAAQLISLVVFESDFGTEWFFRIMGALAILGVLGTIAVPVLVRVLRPAYAVAQPQGAGSAAASADAALLSPALLQRLRERAEAESTTPDALLERLLER